VSAEPIIKFRIATLKARIEASHLICDDLARQFQSAVTRAAKTESALRYRDAVHHAVTLQRLLDVMEREEREGHSHT